MLNKSPRTVARLRGLLAASLTVATIATAPVALSHMDRDEPLQSFRQSYFTLVAMNFGPITAMLKGEMPWDDAKVLSLAEDVKALSTVDVLRAFAPGSDKGTTRAKPEIWDNSDDFAEKYRAFQASADTLLDAAKSGDKSAVGAAVKEMGGACKACHDEYKSKDYLY